MRTWYASLAVLMLSFLSSPLWAQSNYDSMSVSEKQGKFVEGVNFVNHHPLDAGAFKMRHWLAHWSLDDQVFGFRVPECPAVDNWWKSADSHDLVGSVLLMQYLINLDADELVRPEVSLAEHQRVGLRSALLLYIAMQKDQENGPVMEAIRQKANPPVNVLAEQMIAEVRQSGNDDLSLFVCQ